MIPWPSSSKTELSPSALAFCSADSIGSRSDVTPTLIANLTNWLLEWSVLSEFMASVNASGLSTINLEIGWPLTASRWLPTTSVHEGLTHRMTPSNPRSKMIFLVSSAASFSSREPSWMSWLKDLSICTLACGDSEETLLFKIVTAARGTSLSSAPSPAMTCNKQVRFD